MENHPTEPMNETGTDQFDKQNLDRIAFLAGQAFCRLERGTPIPA